MDHLKWYEWEALYLATTLGESGSCVAFSLPSSKPAADAFPDWLFKPAGPGSFAILFGWACCFECSPVETHEYSWPSGPYRHVMEAGLKVAPFLPKGSHSERRSIALLAVPMASLGGAKRKSAGEILNIAFLLTFGCGWGPGSVQPGAGVMIADPCIGAVHVREQDAPHGVLPSFWERGPLPR